MEFTLLSENFVFSQPTLIRAILPDNVGVSQDMPKNAAHTASRKLNIQTRHDARDNTFATMLEKSLIRASLIKEQLSEYGQLGDSLNDSDWKNMKLNLLIEPVETQNNLTFIFGRNSSNLDSTLWSLLSAVCGGDTKFSVTIDVKVWLEAVCTTIKAVDLRIGENGNSRRHFVYTHQDDTFRQAYQQFMRSATTSANDPSEITLKVKLNSEALDRVQLDNLEGIQNIKMDMFLSANEDDIGIFVAQNGAQFKFCTGFFSAHSPDFKRKFNAHKEKEDTQIKVMTNMSEAGVRAFRAYLYCRELRKVIEDPHIAIELLQASNIYDMTSLRDIIVKLILAKEVEWLTTSMALLLMRCASVFTWKDCPISDMEQKGLNALKLKKPSELEQCLEYQDIFKNPNSLRDFINSIIMLSSDRSQHPQLEEIIKNPKTAQEFIKFLLS